MAPYWGLYLRSLAFNAFQIGVLMSLLQVMRIFAPNIWGHIADRTGKRVAIVQIAATVSFISFVGVFWGSSFWWMFAVMSFISFFWSASLPLVEATTLSHLEDRTDRYGLIRLWGSVGFILVVVGLGAVLDHWPIGFCSGSSWACWSASSPSPASFRRRRWPSWRPSTSSLKGVLKRPEVVALLVAAMLMAAAHGPYYTFFTIYLVDTGYSKTVAGWLWALGVICEVGVFMVMPRVLETYPAGNRVEVSLLAASVRFLLIGWCVGSLPLLLLAQMLHALTFAAYHAAAIGLVHRHFRGSNQARGQALYNSLAFGVGGSIGSLYSGASLADPGRSWTYTIAAAFALLGAGGVLFPGARTQLASQAPGMK